MESASRGVLDAVNSLFDALPPPLVRGQSSKQTHARASALMRALGDRQHRFCTVHVAGTAGKGSVAATLSSLLCRHGRSVGTYTSPHAYSFTERIQLNGRALPEELLASTIEGMRTVVAKMARSQYGTPTLFEVLTGIAFSLFADLGVEYGIIEAGIGGRYDATNVPCRDDKLAILTHIGLDHTEALGPSIADIASHKAGVLPADGLAVILAPIDEAVRREILAEARVKRSSLTWVEPQDREASISSIGLSPRFSYESDSYRFTNLPLGLTGAHQIDNAKLALTASEVLAARDGWTLMEDHVRAGLQALRLPGRFELRTWRGRSVILDGAHNADKVVALVESLQAHFPERPTVWVIALREGKDSDEIMKAVKRSAAALIVTRCTPEEGGVSSYSSVSPELLTRAARRADIGLIRSAPSPGHALDLAVAVSNPGDPIVVTGSFHLVGEVDTYLKQAESA